MAEINSHLPGTFCWIDLATTDVEGTKNFYAGLFGWMAREIPVGPGVFTMLQLNGREVASLYQLNKQQQAQGVPAHWMAYVAVASVDDAAERVRSLGGQVLVEPFDVMDLGRMALILGPTGAPLALWQAGQHVGMRLVNRPGTLAWAELITNDPARAGQFYPQLFSWEIRSQNGYIIFSSRGRRIAGMRQSVDAREDSWPQWLVYTAVADCEASVAKIQALGGEVIMPPARNAVIGRYAVLQDSQGARFAILEPDGFD